jgi:hypothetical protein
MESSGRISKKFPLEKTTEAVGRNFIFSTGFHAQHFAKFNFSTQAFPLARRTFRQSNKLSLQHLCGGAEPKNAPLSHIYSHSFWVLAQYIRTHTPSENECVCLRCSPLFGVSLCERERLVVCEAAFWQMGR